ncbi:hypothetical protein Patl1_04853 [Pistacia atlantica]|uniref:Uncharacterized protein n=1 Tax=Pistacia atlantica TaxID=434234 RepID=A0ACC1BR77_9ROSI|nr:hypothetical protein Patl1_04853 [Pistacia atlantica]
MVYQMIMLGTVIATTLLGLFFLNCSRGKKKSGDASMKIHKKERSKRSENLTHPAEVAGSTDVIIVGAGVAGSALAYTLAKDGRRVHVIERDLTEPDRIVGELLQPGGYLKLIELGLEGQELTTYAPLTVVCDGCCSNLRRSLSKPKVEIPACFVGLILENCELPYKNHGHVILADPSPILFYPISSTEIRCLIDVPGQRVPSISNGEMTNYLKTVVAPQVCVICLK